MRRPRFTLSTTLLALAGACFAPATVLAAEDPPVQAVQGQGQADVAVKRVVLFSSGVGYFEHAGTVTGAAQAELSFKTAQINDILKSLVVEDRDGGTVTTIAYPSQDPIEKTLRSFQVDISGNPSLGQLLSQLRGAKVAIKTGDQQFNGTILGTEQVTRVVNDRGETTHIWVLSLLTGATVRSVDLDQIRSLDLEDAALRAELEKALAALAQSRDQDKKPVVIGFQGQGQRRVRVGYVVEAPVWKTSYRLILGKEPAEAHRMQGWAIVENQTDNDWNGVALTLVSGRPISFVQDLYRPLYIPRPVVVPELYASLNPQSYRDGVEEAKAVVAFGGRQEAEKGASMARRNRAAPAAPAGMAMAADMAEMSDAGGIDASQGVQSLASSEKVGEFFQYTVPDVHLARQRSAMIPIVTEEITVERLSIYNQATLAKNPLLGARVKNTTGKHLLGGPVTVLDAGSYAGDARIDDLPPGQDRLISFAVDLQVRILAENQGNSSTLMTGRLVKGVLQLQHKQIVTQDYTIDNKGDTGRTVLIEHPINQGWTLVDTPKPVETTETLYRFQDPVAAATAKKLTVKEERVNWQSVAIIPMDVDSILVWQKNGKLSAGVRDALAKAAALKGAQVDTERQIASRQQKVNEITQEQNRIRANMGTVDQKSQYYQRLLTKLNDQETVLDQLRTEMDALRLQADTQRKELESYLSELSLD